MWKKSKNFIFSFITRRKRKYHAKLVSFNALDYLVREIFPTDMKELLRIERVVYDGDLPWTRSIFLSELYSKKPHLYLGVFDKRQLVAFIGMRVDIYDGHVTNLAVLPQYQKQGIASFLLGEVEKFARKNVCMQMSLEVRVTNLDAQRLYRKFGFISRRRLPRYYDKNQEDALEMVKMLDD